MSQQLVLNSGLIPLLMSLCARTVDANNSISLITCPFKVNNKVSNFPLGGGGGPNEHLEGTKINTIHFLWRVRNSSWGTKRPQKASYSEILSFRVTHILVCVLHLPNKQEVLTYFVLQPPPLFAVAVSHSVTTRHRQEMYPLRTGSSWWPISEKNILKSIHVRVDSCTWTNSAEICTTF